MVVYLALLSAEIANRCKRKPHKSSKHLLIYAHTAVNADPGYTVQWFDGNFNLLMQTSLPINNLNGQPFYSIWYQPTTALVANAPVATVTISYKRNNL